MKSTLISYTLEKANWSNRNAIQRMLNGYKDHSNNNSYTYSREGLLERSGIRLNRGVIIITKNKVKIIKLLKENKATVKTIDIDAPKSIFN